MFFPNCPVSMKFNTTDILSIICTKAYSFYLMQG